MSVEEGERGAAFQKGEDPMGDLIDGEVFADGPLMGLPHEGAFCGIELGKEGAVTLG